MDGELGGGPPKQLKPAPKTRVCYVCGRQYGLSSYDIHLKQCKELFLAREAQKDPRERKPLPEDPMIRLAKSAEMDNMKLPSQKGSSPTKGGGGGDGGMDLEEINRIASEAYNTETLCACQFCGRTFLEEKLKIHNKSCTADKPARRVTDNVRRGNALPPVSDTSAEPTAPRPSTSSRPRIGTSSGARPKPSGGGAAAAAAAAVSTPTRDNMGSEMDGLAGQAGRSLRRPKSLSSTTDSLDTAALSVSTLQSNASAGEAAECLQQKIEEMEAQAYALLNAAAEMRAALNILQGNSLGSTLDSTLNSTINP